MKKVFLYILYFIIELIEKWEFRNSDLDQQDDNKKIIDSLDIDYSVKSDNGFVKANKIHKTQPYDIYRITFRNGYQIECADNHILFGTKMEERYAKDIRVNSLLLTDQGVSLVTNVKKLPFKMSMMDLSIDSPEHRYYTNGVLSHNTITASISILYYCIFNNDKTIMIAANKKETVNEIVTKIKDIYYNLPYFIKPGVSNWNESSVTFMDTGCKIRTSAATKTAAIGFSVDFLYLDEFAHIPNNIVESYYRSVFPTVSNIKNSKIIITSTPNGYNLFHKLLTEKNRYAKMKVYWWQVEGRYVTYLRIKSEEAEKYGITTDDLYDFALSLGFKKEVKEGRFIKEAGVSKSEIFTEEGAKIEICIPNRDEDIPQHILNDLGKFEGDDALIDYLKTLHIDLGNEKKVRLIEVADISSWRMDAINDIGSVEAFNQEYDLQFLAGNKMIFDSQTLSKITNKKEKFEHQEIPLFDEKTFINYENLTWIQDRPDLFHMANVKDYSIIMSVDIAEGLGGDYSVINIFRVMPKPEEEWGSKIESMYDFFKLEQIGLYRSSYISVPELGELLYLLAFELFDQNNLGVVLEVNAFGGELINKMKDLYNGRNLYSSHIFFRYKHRKDSIKKDIGIKLRQNKNLFVKEYQKRMKCGDIMVHEEETIKEITTFIKKETNAGNYTFEADGGNNDDICMTIVEVSTVFENVLFKDIVDRLMDNIDPIIRDKIEKALGESPHTTTIDYSSILKGANRRNGANDFGSQGYDNNNNNVFGGSGGFGGF